MNISTKTLMAFNSGKEPSYNENYNKAMGYPNMLEYAFLSTIRNSLFGMIKGKLKAQDIKDYIQYNEWKPSEALIKHAMREGINL